MIFVKIFMFVWHKPFSSNSCIKLTTYFLKEQNGQGKGVNNFMPLLRVSHLTPVFPKITLCFVLKCWMAPSELKLSNQIYKIILRTQTNNIKTKDLTAETRVQSHVGSYGICGEWRGIMRVFGRLFRCFFYVIPPMIHNRLFIYHRLYVISEKAASLNNY